MAGRAAAGPADAGRAVPCQPTGLSSGPGTACSLGPGQPGPADDRAVPCLVRGKITCFVSDRRASGCMDIYNATMHVRAWALGYRLPKDGLFGSLSRLCLLLL